MLAQTLGLDEAQVRVVKPFVGGGFGHRVEPLNFEMITALLARAAGDRVKMELTREETFITHRGRPASEMRLKIGMKAQRPDHRRRCRGGAARRRLRRLRPGHHPLRRRAAARALQAGRLALSRLPRLHQPAALRRDARPRRGADARFAFEALLDEMAAAARARPVRGAARQPAHRNPVPHAQRPAGQLLRPAGLPRLRSRRLRAGTSGAASCRNARVQARPGHGLLALRQRDRPSRCTGAASRTR